MSKLKLLKILKSLKKLKLAKIERCNFNKLLIFEALLVETIVALVFFVFLLSATSLNKSVPYSSLLKNTPPLPPAELLQGEVQGAVLGVNYSRYPNSIRVSWTSISGVNAYAVRWEGPGSSNWDNPVRLSTSSLGYTISGLSSNSTYHIQVMYSYPGDYYPRIMSDDNISTTAPAPTATPRPSSSAAPRPTSTPTQPPSSCQGKPEIWFSKNPVSPGSTVTVAVRSLSGCAGVPVKFTMVVGSALNSQTRNVSSSGTGTFVTYTAPNNQGRYAVFAWADKNRNNTQEPGEYDSDWLEVSGGGPQPTVTPTPTATPTSPPSACRGPLRINVPDNVNPGASFNVGAQGLTNCSGLWVSTDFVVNDAHNVQKCQVPGSGTGCFKTYTAPSTAGSYPASVVADLDGDNVWFEAGEYETKWVTVGTGPQPSNFQRAVLDNPPGLSCAGTDYGNLIVSANFSWTKGTGGTIEQQWLDYSTQSSFAEGTYVKNNVGTQASSYQITGFASGTPYFWRVNTRFAGNPQWYPSEIKQFSKDCQGPAPSCQGSVAISSLAPNPASSGQQVSATVSGVSNCSGYEAFTYVRSGSDYKWERCPISGSGCTTRFSAPSTPGDYEVGAVVNKNKDADPPYEDGEWTKRTLTVQQTTPQPGEKKGADALGQSTDCTSSNRVKVDFSWRQATGGTIELQYLDYSFVGDSFAPGTYTGIPLSKTATHSTGEFTHNGHFWWRINTRFAGDSQWYPSRVGHFYKDCGGGSQLTPPSDLEDKETGCYQGVPYVVFRWKPAQNNTMLWIDVKGVNDNEWLQNRHRQLSPSADFFTWSPNPNNRMDDGFYPESGQSYNWRLWDGVQHTPLSTPETVIVANCGEQPGGGAPTTPPTLIFPMNMAVNSGNPNFKWQPVSGADKYWVFLRKDDPNFNSGYYWAKKVSCNASPCSVGWDSSWQLYGLSGTTPSSLETGPAYWWTVWALKEGLEPDQRAIAKPVSFTVSGSTSSRAEGEFRSVPSQVQGVKTSAGENFVLGASVLGVAATIENPETGRFNADYMGNKALGVFVKDLSTGRYLSVQEAEVFIEGTLPPGLRLKEEIDAIDGTPVREGTYPFTVMACLPGGRTNRSLCDPIPTSIKVVIQDFQPAFVEPKLDINIGSSATATLKFTYFNGWDNKITLKPTDGSRLPGLNDVTVDYDMPVDSITPPKDTVKVTFKAAASMQSGEYTASIIAEEAGEGTPNTSHTASIPLSIHHVLPSAPTNLRTEGNQCINNQMFNITLAWNQSGNAQGYYVEMALSPQELVSQTGSFRNAQPSPVNGTSKRFTNITNLKKHYWRVWAYNAEGKGTYSHTDNFPTFEPPPGCVTWPQEGGGSYDEILTYVDQLASGFIDRGQYFPNMAEAIKYLIGRESVYYSDWYNENPGQYSKGILQYLQSTWDSPANKEIDPRDPGNQSLAKPHSQMEGYLANSGGTEAPWWVGRGWGGQGDDGNDNNVWNPYAQVRTTIFKHHFQGARAVCEWTTYPTYPYCGN